ncbi:hypothetical protein [Desulforhopalus sp. 52FAK]
MIALFVIMLHILIDSTSNVTLPASPLYSQLNIGNTYLSAAINRKWLFDFYINSI